MAGIKIDVDADDAALVELKATFDKYLAALKASIGVAAGSMALVSKHATDFYQVTTSTARHWHNLRLRWDDSAIEVAAVGIGAGACPGPPAGFYDRCGLLAVRQAWRKPEPSPGAKGRQHK